MKKVIYSIAIIALITSCSVSKTIDAEAEKTVQQESSDLPSLIGTWDMYEGTKAKGESETMVFNSDNTMQTTSASGRVETGTYTYNENTGELIIVEIRGGKKRSTRIMVRFDGTDTARLHGSVPGEPMKGETSSNEMEFDLVLKRKN